MQYGMVMYGRATEHVYFSGSVIRSTTDAIKAVKQAAAMAKAEDPANTAVYRAVIRNATNYGSDVPTILKVGRAQLSLAPKADQYLLNLAYEYWKTVQGGGSVPGSAATAEEAVAPAPLPLAARVPSYALPVAGLFGAVALGGTAYFLLKGRGKGRKRRNPKKGISWWAVAGVTALAAGDAVTPGFPFPGSAIIMVPLAGATWLAKLSEYGVSSTRSNGKRRRRR